MRGLSERSTSPPSPLSVQEQNDTAEQRQLQESWGSRLRLGLQPLPATD